VEQATHALEELQVGQTTHGVCYSRHFHPRGIHSRPHFALCTYHVLFLVMLPYAFTAPVPITATTTVVHRIPTQIATSTPHHRHHRTFMHHVLAHACRIVSLILSPRKNCV